MSLSLITLYNMLKNCSEVDCKYSLLSHILYEVKYVPIMYVELFHGVYIFQNNI